jgi:hypothetical protein
VVHDEPVLKKYLKFYQRHRLLFKSLSLTSHYNFLDWNNALIDTDFIKKIDNKNIICIKLTSIIPFLAGKKKRFGIFTFKSISLCKCNHTTFWNT